MASHGEKLMRNAAPDPLYVRSEGKAPCERYLMGSSSSELQHNDIHPPPALLDCPIPLLRSVRDGSLQRRSNNVSQSSSTNRRPVHALFFTLIVLAVLAHHMIIPLLRDIANSTALDSTIFDVATMPSRHHAHPMSLASLLRCSLVAFLLRPAMCASIYGRLPHKQRGDDALLLTTPLGALKGVAVGQGVSRFTVPYAQPPINDLRFANPQAITSFDGHNTTTLPASCYQGSDVRGENESSEDCLYNTIYRPNTATTSKTPLPILVWIHGGSGIAGSASQAGLDGSTLAAAQQAIVVVMQYRLSLFGWLQTGDTLDEGAGGTPGANKVAGNQAMRDVVMALQQLHDLAPLLGGGSAPRVTVMGQSSGAIMVRALLTTPAAQSLFTNAILVSDPQNYGLSSVQDNTDLGEAAMNALGCDLNDLACARSKSADDVLSATYAAYTGVPQTNPRISSGTPWRPMVGSFVSSSLASAGYHSKDVIMTTTANEMGSLVGSSFDASPPGADMLTYAGSTYTDTLGAAVNLLFGPKRGAGAAGNTQVYAVNATQPDAMRSMMDTIATDGMWRCATQYNAVQMAKAGSRVWLAEWQTGATYISNANNEYCKGGRVCHEDDIYAIFGTMPNANDVVERASKEMQARYAAFSRSSKPNAQSGAAAWAPVAAADRLNMLIVNPDGSTSIVQSHHAEACAGTIWGAAEQYDWQLYSTTT